MWAGADVTSIKRAGRITTFGFAVGAGLLIASGAGAAVAAAAPDESGQRSSSSASSSSSSSARSARPSTRAATKPKPAHTVSARQRLLGAGRATAHRKRTPAAASTSAVSATDDITAVPAASAKPTAPKRVPGLPTPDLALRTITDGLGTVRRSLDELREKIETLVQNQIIGFQDNLVTPAHRPGAPFPPEPADHLRQPGQRPILGGRRCTDRESDGRGDGDQRAQGPDRDRAGIVNEAMDTDSVATTGPENVLWAPTPTIGCGPTDAVQLMETHGLKVSTVYYSKSQEQRAWNGHRDRACRKASR